MKKQIIRLTWRQSLGKAGEKYVTNLLVQNGWQIKERNWRAGRYSEIDIIAYDPEKILVFVEVKTRIKNDSQIGFPSAGFDKLDRRKSQKLIGCARLYMAKCMPFALKQERGCRFDAFVLYYPVDWQRIFYNFHGKTDELKPEVQYIKDFLS